MNVEDIKAEIKNLKKILVDDEKFYQVPHYQRPYRWDKDQLSALIDDLITAYTDNKDKTYFCGSLVLVKNENESDNRLDIIDGQQRITTFIIMSCVFRDLYSSKLEQKAKDFITASIQYKYDNNKIKLRFLTDMRYQNDFEETVLKVKEIDFDVTKEVPKDNQYLQNAHAIKELLKERTSKIEININDFVIWFFEKVELTFITCPDQGSAIKIFNVLNTRGMPLESTDILKSTLMQRQDSGEDREAFNEKWKTIDDKLKEKEKDESLKDIDLNLVNMLTAYLYYKLAANPKSSLDKELLAIFEKEAGSRKIEPGTIINEIGGFSEAYIKALTAKDKDVYCLRYLRHKIYWKSILSTAAFTKYPHIAKLKELLVAYYYQNWIAGGTAYRIKQTSFNILELIKSGEPIDKISSEMNANLEKYSTTETFKTNVMADGVYYSNWAKALLLLIEYFSSDDSKQNYIALDGELHLEHVLPQTPTAEWKNIFNEDERKKWTDSLANLTLLSMKKNIQAQNDSFAEKKDTYKNRDKVTSAFQITQELDKYDQWDVTELEKRQKYLYDRIMDKLDLFPQ